MELLFPHVSPLVPPGSIPDVSCHGDLGFWSSLTAWVFLQIHSAVFVPLLEVKLLLGASVNGLFDCIV